MIVNLQSILEQSSLRSRHDYNQISRQSFPINIFDLDLINLDFSLNDCQ